MAGGMKRLAKETAIYGLSSIIGKFLNYLLVPFYVRVLTDQADYGIVTNIYGWTALLIVILTYGMETGFFRFINKKEEDKPLRVYSTTLFSLGLTSSLFIFLVLIFLTPLSKLLDYTAHPEYLGIMLVVVAIDAFCSIPFAYLRYQGRPLRFAFLKLTNIFLNIALNLFFFLGCPWLYREMPETIDWFYRLDYGVGYVFVANMITTFVTLLLLIPDIFPAFRVKPDLSLLKKMLRYSFPILLLGVAGIFNQTADKIIFPYLFDDKDYAQQQLGIYGACFRMAAVMVMFIQAFRYAYEPFIFARHKGDTGHQSYIEAMKYFVIFGLLIFLGVMFYMDIFKYFLRPDYYPGIKVIPIVMMGEFFFGIYFNLSFWYKLTDQTHWGAWFSTAGCVITVAIIVLFVPAYGYMACAWASFFSNLFMMLLSYVIGQKKFPIAYDLRSAFIYFLLAAILFVAAMLPDINSLGLRLTYRTLLLAIFIGFILKRDLPLRELPYIGRFFK